MKRTYLVATKRVIAASLIAAVFAVSSVKAGDKIEILSEKNQANVQYVGTADNALFFNVKVNNPKGDKFTVIVKTADGITLYNGDFTDTNFDKKFKLLKGDENIRYSFNIRSANKSLEQSFNVNTITKSVDDVEITKL